MLEMNVLKKILPDDIQAVKEQPYLFIADIDQYTKELVITNAFITNTSKNEKEIIGYCPRCEKPVYGSEKPICCPGFKNPLPCLYSLLKKEDVSFIYLTTDYSILKIVL